MTIELEIELVRPFVSQEVSTQENASVDLERFKREIEQYLQEMLRAVVADLQNIRDNCCQSGVSP